MANLRKQIRKEVKESFDAMSKSDEEKHKEFVEKNKDFLKEIEKKRKKREKKIKTTFAAMPNEQKLKRMIKEMKKIESELSKYGEDNPAWYAWADSRTAGDLLEQSLRWFKSAKKFEKSSPEMALMKIEDAQRFYEGSIYHYDNAKRRYKNLKK